MVALGPSLRSSTKHLHAKLEEATRLPQSLGTLADIERVLATFWGYYAALDSLLKQAPTGDLPTDITERPLRSLVLAHDLDKLGSKVTQCRETSLCSNLPLANTVYRQWGIRYVVEGSALGGMIIRAHMLRQPQLAPWADKIQFFNIYGTDTARQWNAFQSEIVKLDPNPAEEAQAIEAAKGVFATLRNWFAIQPNSVLEQSKKPISISNKTR